MADLTLAGLTDQAIKVRGNSLTMRFPEAASQTFVVGDFVLINSGGQVAIAATAGNSLDSTGSNLIGRAREAASGTTNTLIECEVCTADTEYLLPAYHATPASAVSAYTNNDTVCTLINETTGGWMVDIGTTSNGILPIMEVAKSYDGQVLTVGGQYNPHWCKVNSAGRFYKD